MIVLMMNVLFFICQFFKITIVAHMAFEKRSFFRASSGMHMSIQYTKYSFMKYHKSQIAYIEVLYLQWVWKLNGRRLKVNARFL